MKVLFLYNGAESMGGIETLMARLATCFADRGDEVICLLRNASPIQALFPSSVQVISSGECLSNLMQRSAWNRISREHDLGAPDCLISMDRLSASLAPLLLRFIRRPGARCIATNWVPNYVANLVEHPWHPMSLLQRVSMRRHYTRSSLLFMNQQYERDAQAVLGLGFDTTIFPVSVNLEQFSGVARVPERSRIVSIGRLEPMKEYNLYLFDVVEDLNRTGHKIRWDVYGYGEFEGWMRNEVSRRGLDDQVVLHGTLERAKVPAVLAGAGIFVGMGRAMMEAACVGVPHVVAIAFDREGITHGPIYRTSLGNIGDRDLSLPVFRVADELRRILELSDEDYRRESELVRAHMARYAETTVMRILFAAAENAVSRPAGWLYSISAGVYVGTRNLLRAR